MTSDPEEILNSARGQWSSFVKGGKTIRYRLYAPGTPKWLNGSDDIIQYTSRDSYGKLQTGAVVCRHHDWTGLCFNCSLHLLKLQSRADIDAGNPQNMGAEISKGRTQALDPADGP